MKIVTKEEIIRRIQNKYPNQPFEIIEYTRVIKPITIKCLKCNQTKTYSSTANFLASTRKGVCSCYNEDNHLTRHYKNKEEILETINNDDTKTFLNFGYQDKDKKYTVSILCNKCNQVYKKTWASFFKDMSCPFCENKQKMNTKGFQALLPKEYELLSEYVDQQTKVLIKHECGFIWKISPHGFFKHTGCPKCNKRRSQGERKVEKFLDENYIAYVPEKSFNWQTNLRRRYDFYLPEYNLVIEYMGEQHYKECSLFQISLKEQQEIDEEKRLDALKNNYNYLAICYKDQDKIADILTKAISSTTSRNGVDLSESKE